MAAPVRDGVGAIGGQGRGGAGPGSDGSGRLRVADLWGHVIRLPALQLLLDQPVHLLPMAFCVAPQTFILTGQNTDSQLTTSEDNGSCTLAETFSHFIEICHQAAKLTHGLTHCCLHFRGLCNNVYLFYLHCCLCVVFFLAFSVSFKPHRVCNFISFVPLV